MDSEWALNMCCFNCSRFMRVFSFAIGFVHSQSSIKHLAPDIWKQTYKHVQNSFTEIQESILEWITTCSRNPSRVVNRSSHNGQGLEGMPGTIASSSSSSSSSSSWASIGSSFDNDRGRPLEIFRNQSPWEFLLGISLTAHSRRNIINSFITVFHGSDLCLDHGHVL